MIENKPEKQMCVIGNCEGLASLFCLCIVLVAPNTVDSWLFIAIVFSLGIGFGLGAMRFGNAFGKKCGALSLILFWTILDFCFKSRI